MNHARIELARGDFADLAGAFGYLGSKVGRGTQAERRAWWNATKHARGSSREPISLSLSKHYVKHYGPELGQNPAIIARRIRKAKKENPVWYRNARKEGYAIVKDRMRERKLEAINDLILFADLCKHENVDTGD
jgi:hypothetical protein